MEVFILSLFGIEVWFRTTTCHSSKLHHISFDRWFSIFQFLFWNTYSIFEGFFQPHFSKSQRSVSRPELQHKNQRSNRISWSKSRALLNSGRSPPPSIFFVRIKWWRIIEWKSVFPCDHLAHKPNRWSAKVNRKAALSGFQICFTRWPGLARYSAIFCTRSWGAKLELNPGVYVGTRSVEENKSPGYLLRWVHGPVGSGWIKDNFTRVFLFPLPLCIKIVCDTVSYFLRSSTYSMHTPTPTLTPTPTSASAHSRAVPFIPLSGYPCSGRASTPS